MDITCIFVYNMLLKMFNKYNPVANEVILEIIFFYISIARFHAV